MSDDIIELWELPLSAEPRWRELLGDRERRRAERLVVDDKREQFVAAQVGLRRVLSLYLGVPAAAVEFDYGPHGKPFLPARSTLGFNMTHSAELALVAVGQRLEVGVDLEWTGRSRPFLRLARRYFADGEHRWLDRLPRDEQRGAFYRTWTLKEAYLKAVGTGLTVPPDRFELDLDRSPAVLRSTELDGDRPGKWRFAEPAVDPEYAAALCWSGAGRRLVHRAAPALSGVRDR